MNSPARSTDRAEVVQTITDWFAHAARDLPWRRSDRTPWGVFVSEFMLQQTPVARVLEPWAAWLARWPTPAALADAPVGEAIRAWGRLGYPRRAVWLHASATAMVREHDGEVPDSVEALLRLPGVGRYTAAAVASFGYGQSHVVLDVNVRRVLARLAGSDDLSGAPDAAEWRRAAQWLPAGAAGPIWSAAVMEFGARICTARSPDCAACPVAQHCAWLAAGRPPGQRAKPQSYLGTDRHCRGQLLDLARQEHRVPVEVMLASWPDRTQAERCLAGLVSDGLLRRSADQVWL